MIEENKNVCQVEGCKKEPDKCIITNPDTHEEMEEYFCVDHKHENGYCIGCGYFYSGTNEFDFKHPGWCDNCFAEISAYD